MVQPLASRCRTLGSSLPLWWGGRRMGLGERGGDLCGKYAHWTNVKRHIQTFGVSYKGPVLQPLSFFSGGDMSIYWSTLENYSEQT